VPVDEAAVASTVKVDVKPGVPDCGEKLYPSPAGRPDSVRKVVAEEPLTRFTVREKEILSPILTVWVDGEIEIEKSNGGAREPTVREALVWWTTPLADPITTIV